MSQAKTFIAAARESVLMTRCLLCVAGMVIILGVKCEVKLGVVVCAGRRSQIASRILVACACAGVV